MEEAFDVLSALKTNTNLHLIFLENVIRNVKSMKKL